MLRRILILGVVGTMSVMFLAGCGIASEQKDDNPTESVAVGNNVLTGLRTGYQAKWKRFKRGSEETIRANEYRIVAFRVKMEEGGPRFKARHRGEVTLLEEKNRVLKMKLEGYQDAGQVKYEEFRTDFNDDLERVGKSMTALFDDK